MTTESFSFAQVLASALSAGLISGALSPFNYSDGPLAPGPGTGTGTGGVVAITTVPSTSVAIPTTDSGTFITVAATITGGGAGETVISGAGSAGLTYTDITPAGAAIDYIIAGDGPNLIETTPNTTGNYEVVTGAGNDTISVNDQSLINAGTGQNSISVTGGDSYIDAQGNDDITGSTVVGGGGTDTIDLGSGQVTVNPGTPNFVVTPDPGAGALLFNAGTGSDTISVGTGGGTVTAGTGGYNILFAGASGPSGAATILHGTANGDELFASGSTPVLLTAGYGRETLTGAGGVAANGTTVLGATADNTFMAGSGNDTLIAGDGRDTLIGGTGTAIMASGTGPDLFSFTSGTGGHDIITGFKAADTLQFVGYGISTLPSTSTGGNTLVTLNDGTMVTLAGVSALNPGQVVLK